MAESVADVASRPKAAALKRVFILALVSFGATMDRSKALLITLAYFVLSMLFA
jgi:hypothetical protein